jgi:hypothetical protein
MTWGVLEDADDVLLRYHTSTDFSIHYNWITFLGSTIANVCETFLWSALTKAARFETHFDPATWFGETPELNPVHYVQVNMHMSGVICGPALRHYPPFSSARLKLRRKLSEPLKRGINNEIHCLNNNHASFILDIKS